MRKIVISGTAGWMTAVAFANTMGETVDLTLVESDAIGTIGVDNTNDNLQQFNEN